MCRHLTRLRQKQLTHRSLMKTVISGFVEDDSDLAFLLSRRVWVTTGFLLAAPLACSRTVGALRFDVC